MPQHRILIIEDEQDLAKLLKYNLEKEGYHVILAFDGEEGLTAYRKESPDIVILDVMLPKMDGFEILKSIRKSSETPILMLTAKKEEVDKILGLELGADDYVTKPFSVREVMARIKTIIRRTTKAKDESTIVRFGQVEVDLERYETRVKGKPVSLGSREFEFLKHLIQADGKALTRDQLLERVWGYDEAVNIDTRTVDQHIARLRDKLASESTYIKTVKNVGYRLKMDD